jgi:DNA adenine methylase
LVLQCMNDDSRPCPFLKCAGGKRALAAEIARHIPTTHSTDNNYYEPFLGGGALFFHLISTDCIQSRQAILSDANPFFMSVYEAVRGQLDELLVALSRHAASHEPGHFSQVRSTLDETTDLLPKAAATLYLNKTCFNGLWRVNKAGRFNVPIGRYVNPDIVQEKNLRAAHLALRHTTLKTVDFQSSTENAKAGDVIYFDPPYVPASKTADFTAYTSERFTAADQTRLRDWALVLAKRGVLVILSNSDTPVVRDLYAQGFTLHPVAARRAINSKADKRGPVGEFILVANR